MLSDEAHRKVLKEDYERHRARAEKARKRNRYDEAATHYENCAALLTDIAELETSKRVATERLELAENLRTAAKRLTERAEDAHERAHSERNTIDPGRSTEQRSQKNETETSTDTESTPPTPDKSSTEANEFLEAPPDIDFDDVGGMTALKQTLTDKVIDPLERPELYEEYNLGVVNGVLLYGPPGTGKTYITRALAGKLGYNFIDVTPADITSSLVGAAADNVAELFEVARENQPCLVFIDEIDAIAGSRSGGAQKTQSERQMVNQLLEELSAVQREDVVVVGATNLLDEVDDAIKRSGRFDERIEVPPPDATAREAILRVHLRDRPVLTEAIDWETVRTQTDGYAASDMELIATNAARQALKEARETDEIQPVTQQHIETAIEETNSSLTNWE